MFQNPRDLSRHHNQKLQRRRALKVVRSESWRFLCARQPENHSGHVDPTKNSRLAKNSRNSSWKRGKKRVSAKRAAENSLEKSKKTMDIFLE